MKEFEKTYEPKKYEEKIYRIWEKSGFFNPEKCVKEGVTSHDAKSFTVVLPPPNVTGTLHMGHASTLAIEDVMVRFQRMKGNRTLWIPGTDHAAIATQSKVERLIFEKEKKTKYDFGREKFLKLVQEFAKDSHDTIVSQCKKMGASLDWTREAYTLDEKRNFAVRTAFKMLYDFGLIYRGQRVINWDPNGQTVISDDEVVYKEIKTTLYTFRYSKDFPIPIATTRPETKVGDTAVAVHPDGKWKKYIGKEFKNIQFAGALINIKIVGEHTVDESFGTGALGVTPAHSSIDSDIAMNHSLSMIQVIDENAKMTANAGELLNGLTTIEARKKVVQWLRDENLLENEDETIQNLSVAERTGGIIEPLPKLQWFIAVNKEFDFECNRVTLKELMRSAVTKDGIQFIPKRFETTYFHWVDNLRDWCISRQIWFGHRIPVWFCKKCDDTIVSVNDVEKCKKCDGAVEQDSDTLDTWFSAGLWTFSTLGWPEKTEDLKIYHPTSVLETGYDILFFWIARMILMTKTLQNEIPFKYVYLHGLVRDEQGRKMSKSLDNIIDPRDMIEKYGTDATRLSLIIGSTSGNDIKLSEEKIAGFRNFTNKLWNIGRFVLTTTSGSVRSYTQQDYNELFWEDQWIIGRLAQITDEISVLIEKFEFSRAGEILREFTWNEFADWYIEIAKIRKNKDAVLRTVFATLLKLWHPYMPYVTEMLWARMGDNDIPKADISLLMIEKWPINFLALNIEAVEKFNLLKDIIIEVRNLRGEYKIPVKQKIELWIETTKFADFFQQQEQSEIICGLARVSLIEINKKINEQSSRISSIVNNVKISIPFISGDIEKECERVQKEFDNVSRYIESLEKKLSSAEFIANAPEKIVENEKIKFAYAQEKKKKLEEQLKFL